MIILFIGFYQYINNIDFNRYVDMIMEHGHHGMIISSFIIFYNKGYYLAVKNTPWSSEGCFVLISHIDQNLIVTDKYIYKGKWLMTNNTIYNHINIWERKIILRKFIVNISKINRNLYLSIWFCNRIYIGHPF